ncbi:hypothetical protein [Actinokineospora sp.]|uniref:hypothetical protein n=1 Tax=Actinokineospora sp. TaxID=1872133 RepID=UPI004037EBFE
MALHAGTPGHWWMVLPAAIAGRLRPAARPELARGERVLAESGGPSAVVASTCALYLRRDDLWSRLGWEEIDQVSGPSDAGEVTVTGLDGAVFRLDGPGSLPGVIRDRVAAAVVATIPVALDRGGAVITVRGRPGSDELVWSVRLSADLAPADPEVRAWVDAAIRGMRSDLGLRERG